MYIVKQTRKARATYPFTLTSIFITRVGRSFCVRIFTVNNLVMSGTTRLGTLYGLPSVLIIVFTDYLPHCVPLLWAQGFLGCVHVLKGTRDGAIYESRTRDFCMASRCFTTKLILQSVIPSLLPRMTTGRDLRIP